MDPENKPDPDPGTADSGGSSVKTDDTMGDTGLKALQRERDARKALEAEVKTLRPLADKAKELEDANKSEQEKLLERLAAAEKREADTTVRLLRAEVASEKGLSTKQAARLTGSTREELEADADEFLADLKDTHVSKGTTSPQDTGAGVGGDSKDDDEDPLVLARAAMGSMRR